ncbi:MULTISPECIES: nucleotide-binding protein [Pseudomonas syringae group]|nr:conjugal transfer protein, TraL family [Pseudomonas syringae group genomosp. 3]
MTRAAPLVLKLYATNHSIQAIDRLNSTIGNTMNNLMPMENTTHWILQGKGGVGKSFASSILAQYMIERGHEPACGDTDPVNSTFYQIAALNVQLIKIAEDGIVMQRLFDPLFESILLSDRVSVVDNGASTFLPFAQFIKSNCVLETMQEYGKQVFIHCVVTGGQSKDDTAAGLISLIDLVRSTQSNAKIVVWVNEFWGKPTFDGKTLEQNEWFQEALPIIQGVVTIVQRNGDDFITDIRLMTERHMTYREVKVSTDFGLMPKSRIFNVFNDVYRQLDVVFSREDGSSNE